MAHWLEVTTDTSPVVTEQFSGFTHTLYIHMYVCLLRRARVPLSLTVSRATFLMAEPQNNDSVIDIPPCSCRILPQLKLFSRRVFRQHLIDPFARQ